MNDPRLAPLRRLAAAALAATALFAAGCGNDVDATTDDGDDNMLDVAGSADSRQPAASTDANAGAASLASGFESAPGNSVVYREGDYMEVKYAQDGTTRLLVVSPENKDAALDKGVIAGEDFKLIGRKSPVGVSVLGENELKDKFYQRWGVEGGA